MTEFLYDIYLFGCGLISCLNYFASNIYFLWQGPASYFDHVRSTLAKLAFALRDTTVDEIGRVTFQQLQIPMAAGSVSNCSAHPVFTGITNFNPDHTSSTAHTFISTAHSLPVFESIFPDPVAG